MKQQMLIKLDPTKKRQLPAAWEAGGGTRSNGEALLIADGEGLPKGPFAVKDFINGDHALIPISIGDWVVKAYRFGVTFEILVGQVASIESIGGELFAACEVHFAYNRLYWSMPLYPKLKEVVEKAKAKASEYHCRRPFYIRGWEGMK